MAAVHPLWSFVAGDDYAIQGTCTDADGNIIDLTGAAAEWKLCAECSDVPAFDLTVGQGITVVNAAAGELTIAVTGAQTAPVPPGRYRDQLRITTASGSVSTQWIGFIDVKPAL